MKKSHNNISNKWAVALLITLAATPTWAVKYKIDRPSPYSVNVFNNLNDFGTVVGQQQTPPYNGFRWDAHDNMPTDLGNLGGDGINGGSYPRDINNNGMIAGLSWLYESNVYKAMRGVRWGANDTTPTDLGDLGPNSDGIGYSDAYVINNKGVAVGVSELHDSNVFIGQRAIRWGVNDTIPTNLGTLGTLSNGNGFSWALYINDNGVAVGYSNLIEYNVEKGQRAVRWGVNDTTPTNLGTLGTFSDSYYGYSIAFNINNKGVAVGASYLFDSNVYKGSRAVRWGANDTKPTNLGTLGHNSDGIGYSDAYVINNKGVAVGVSELYKGHVYKGIRAVRWGASDTKPTNLGTLGTDNNGKGSSYAADINNNCVAVGVSELYKGNINKGSRAVLWDESGLIHDLNNLLTTDEIAEGWQLTSAFKINNNDQILAVATKKDIIYNLVLSPVFRVNGFNHQVRHGRCLKHRQEQQWHHSR